jgi:hypothetical protein
MIPSNTAEQFGSKLFQPKFRVLRVGYMFFSTTMFGVIGATCLFLALSSVFSYDGWIVMVFLLPGVVVCGGHSLVFASHIARYITSRICLYERGLVVSHGSGITLILQR